MKNLKDLNWNQLYYFYEVAKQNSFKEAAKVLGIAPSTLSEHIKKLEKSLASKLINRNAKGLTLTSTGKALYERSKNIFEEGSKVVELFSEEALGGYPVYIGIDETISYDLSNELASQYWDYYTHYGTVNTVRQVNHDVLIESILNGNIDFGLSIHKPKRKALNFELVDSFEVVFCCSEELFRKFISKVDLLNNIPFGQSNWDSNLNKEILKYLKRYGVTPKEIVYSDHSGYLQKLCTRGRCVTYLPKNPLNPYSGLKTFQFDEPFTINLYAIWKKSDEKLISIQKLQELINSKLSHLPHRYKDVDLQIEASEVEDDLLKE